MNKTTTVNHYYIISDLHLKRVLFTYMIEYLDELKNKIVNDKVNNVLVIIGDVFDDRKKVSHFLINQFEQFLIEITAHFDRVVIIVGNHDKDEDDSQYSLLTTYGHMYGVEVYDEFYYNKQQKELYMPFYSDEVWYKYFAQAVEELDGKVLLNDVVVFCHKTFAGFRLNKTNRQTSGLPIDILDNFEKVFGGDLHLRQEQGNIIVVGSTFQENFGEDTNKGVVLYKRNKGIVKMYDDSPVLYGTYEYHIEKNFDFQSIYAQLDLVAGTIPNVKIVLIGNLKHLNKFPETDIKQKFLKKFQKFKIVFDVRDKVIRDEMIQEQGDFEDDFISYCKQENMSKKQMRYGIKLISGVAK